MYNSGRRGKRTNDGYGVISTADNFNQSEYPIPTVTSFSITDGSYNPLPDTAVDTAGGQTIVVNGSGFRPGATIMVGGTTIGAVTYIDQGRLAFTAPTLSSASYTIIVSNSNGGTGILVPGLVYSGLPTWTTSAGSVGSVYETKPISQSFAATGDAPLTYALYSGTLPSGSSLQSDGTLSGSAPADSGSTTYSFTIRAYDAQNQHSDRSFSLTVNTDTVTWSTPSSNEVITAYEYAPISNVTALATSAAGYGVLYSANATPTGITIDANTGLISGTANTVGNTYSQLTATANTTVKNATRDVVFNVNEDVVTWSSPADAAVYSLTGGLTMANVTMSATSAAGRSITYTANALPSGVGISGNIIYGTPDAAQTVTTLLTATATTTNRTATRTISWTISLGDSYWKNTTLLLNGATSSNTFINDVSLNNAQLTIAGDTRPSNFNPYNGQYYSNYFDGTGDALTIANNTAFDFGSGNWTIEFWINTSSTVEQHAYSKRSSTGDYSPIIVGINTNKLYVLGSTTGSSWNINSGFALGTISIPSGVWTHIAVVRNSTTVTGYVNGVADVTYTGISGAMMTNTSAVTVGSGTTAVNNPVFGYISNMRVIKGTALYTSTFTPPTSPLTSVANTQLLTCQSNRLIDNSTNNFAITKNGDTTVSPAQPFTTPTTSAYNTQYSTTFDGTTDYLVNTTMPALGSGDFTVECWVYNKSNISGATVFSVGDSASSPFSNIGLLNSGGNGWQLYVAGASMIANWNDVYFTSYPLNTWQHHAVVRSGTNLSWYINGVQVKTTASGSGTMSIPGVYIGYSQAIGAASLNGLVSNFRIVKGTALYTANFTPSTTPLTAVANTSLLTCQDATVKDNSTNAYAITVTGQAQPIALSPFTTTTSNTTVTSLGSAYFDGTGDYLSTDAMSLGTSNFTIEGWCYLTSVANGSATVFSMGGSGTYPSMSLYLNLGTTNYWVIRSQDPSGTVLINENSITFTNTNSPLNQWVHFAVSRVNGTVTLYLNGTQTYQATGITTNFTQTGMYIGNKFAFWPGYISDLSVTIGSATRTSNFLPPQTPLTPVANTQLLTVQTNGGATNNGFVDQSSFNNIVTRAGNVSQGTFSPFSQTGWSNYFDGSGDSLIVNAASGSTFGTGNFTIEGWIFRTGAGTDESIFVQGVGGSSGYGLALLSLKIRVRTPSIQDNSKLTGDIVTRNTWHHVALVRNSGTTSLYFNGTSVMSFADTSSETATEWNIGHYGSSDYVFNGHISNLRVLKGTALYTSNFTPSTVPLTAVANTQLLTCQSNRIIDNSLNNFAITKAGDVSVQAFSPFGGVTSVPTSYSNYFDGTGDQLQFNVSTTPFTFGTGDFTMECWVNMPETTSAKYLIMLGPIANAAPLLYFRNNPYNFYLYYSNGYRGNTTSTILPNTWYHVAVSRTSGTLKIFLNGVEEYSATDTTNFTSSAGYPYISGNAVAGNIMNGHISNVRIVKGTGLYTSNFTPSTSPLTTTSQGATASEVSLLTCQSDKLVDNSLNKFTPTVTGDTKPRPFNPFGTTNTTSVSYSPSVNGGSMYFDGNVDYLSITDPVKVFNTTTDNWTIQGWYYWNNADSAQVPAFIYGTNSAAAGRLAIFWANDNYFYVSDTVAVNPIFTNATTMFRNEWVHIAVVNNAGTLSFYKNGVKIVSATNTLTSTNITTLYVGAHLGNSWYAKAHFSDVSLTKAALYTSNFYPGPAPLTPTTTIGANTYHSSLLLSGTSGGIVDAHGTNNLETVGNTQLASEDPYGGNYYSNYFDGTGDYLDVGTPMSLSGDFTIEMWIKPDLVTKTYSEFFTSASANFELLLNTSTLSLWTIVSHQTPVTAGVWHHVALTRSGSTIYLYLDGVRSTSSGTSSTTFTPYRIGTYAGSEHFPGSISNLRVVSGSVLYSGSTITVPTTALTAVSGTQLLTCQSNTFKDNSTNNATITRAGDTKVKSINPFQNNTGKSLYFDGTGDYLKISNSGQTGVFNGDFTIECWVYYDATSITNYAGIVGGDSGNFVPVYALSTNKLECGIWGSSAIVTSNGTIATRQWVYVALVRSSGVVRWYINGTQDSATASNSSTLTVVNPVIGSSPTAAWNGYIKDLRITKGVARYTTTFTPPTAPLQVQ